MNESKPIEIGLPQEPLPRTAPKTVTLPDGRTAEVAAYQADAPMSFTRKQLEAMPSAEYVRLRPKIMEAYTLGLITDDKTSPAIATAKAKARDESAKRMHRAVRIRDAKIKLEKMEQEKRAAQEKLQNVKAMGTLADEFDVSAAEDRATQTTTDYDEARAALEALKSEQA